MLEIELKFEVQDKTKIEKTLAKNFKFFRKAFEITEMYDNARKELNKVDARLRVRRIMNLDNGKTTCELSYKRPLSRKRIKKEEEITVKVDEYHELISLFSKLGFSKVSSYERIRSTYLSNNAEIVLDEFPFGTYLEIEGKEKDIKMIAKRLGFSLSKNITKSCDDLYAEIQNALNRPVKDNIVFSKPQRKKL